MLRWAARLLLAAFGAGAVALTLWSAARIARDPALGPLVAASATQIAATTDRLMAANATPKRLSALITDRLQQTPRNWVALQALDSVAGERGVALLPQVRTAYAEAWAADNGLAARARGCAACIWDPATCSITNALLCQAPVALTPLGDLVGIARAGAAYASGGAIDEIDLGLSIVGLAATALIVASAGTSATVKAGAGTARLARRMGLLSPRLAAFAARSVRAGVDWSALPAVRSTADLAAALRPAALAPLVATATDLGRLRDRLGTVETLHLLRLIDTPADANGLARAADALGPRLLGRVEVLGKARLLRATLRLGDVAFALIAGLFGVLHAAAAAIGSLGQAALLRLVRRRLR